jgi:hypothetical protein
MKLLIITNNPQRASFRQRFGAYLPILAAGGIDCRVAALPACRSGCRSISWQPDQTVAPVRKKVKRLFQHALLMNESSQNQILDMHKNLPLFDL